MLGSFFDGLYIKCWKCFSPNVPSCFATYFLKNLLMMFLIFCCYPSFSATPRRYSFYCGIRMILVHAPFSKTSIFMKSNSKHYRTFCFLNFMLLLASISVSICSSISNRKWTQNDCRDSWGASPFSPPKAGFRIRNHSNKQRKQN